MQFIYWKNKIDASFLFLISKTFLFSNFILHKFEMWKQDSWEDVEEEKKDVEKPAEAPKVKNKPKKTLADKIEEREVCIIYYK